MFLLKLDNNPLSQMFVSGLREHSSGHSCWMKVLPIRFSTVVMPTDSEYLIEIKLLLPSHFEAKTKRVDKS